MFSNGKNSYQIQKANIEEHEMDIDSISDQPYSTMDNGFLFNSKGSVYAGSIKQSMLCHIQQNIRKTYHFQLLIFIGIVLVGFLICAGVGFLFVITVSNRYNIKTLLDKMETLEENMAHLRYNIDAVSGQGFIAKNSSENPTHLAMRNILPSHLWEQVMRKDESKTGTRVQPNAALALGPYSRYLMGGLNQTVRSLDRDNKMMLNKLANSVDKLNDKFNLRENEIATQLNRYWYKLQELQNLMQKLVTVTEITEIQSKMDAILELTKDIHNNQSNCTSSNSLMLEQIGSTTNNRFESLRNFTADELIKVNGQIYEMFKTLENNTAEYKRIHQILDDITIHSQTIGVKSDKIKNHVEYIRVVLDPINEKIDLILKEQQQINASYMNFKNGMEDIRRKTNKTHNLLTKREDDSKRLSDIIEFVTAIDLKIGQLETFLNTQLLRDSIVKDKTFSDESSSSGFNEKSMHQLETLLNRELKNVLKGMKAIVKGESTALSSYVIKEVQELINNCLQTIEVGLRNDSKLLTATTVHRIHQIIEEKFKLGVEALKNAFRVRLASHTQTTASPVESSQPVESGSVQTNVCLSPHGCTSVEYASKRCFKIMEASQDASTWFEAKRKCQLMGGHLAEIVNLREYDLLIKSLPSYGNYWLGGTDRGSEGYWHWDHSLQKIFLNSWAPGQPDNKAFIEHCLHILHDEFTVWNDMRCAAKIGYICEKEETTCDDWM